MILLGAGASAAGGVPWGQGFTDALVRHVDRLAGRDLTLLVNYLLGELLAQKSRAGERPIGEGQAFVDVEELVRAVRDLRDRSKLPLAAFVASWHPVLERLEGELISSFETRSFLDSLEQATASLAESSTAKSGRSKPAFFSWTSSGRLERAFQEAVREVARGDTAGIRLRRLEETLLDALWEQAWITDPTKVDYLRPLLAPLSRQHSLVVATLNYDNSVELAAESEGLACDMGIGNWLERGEFDPSAPGLHLLKLHGSVDWRLKTTGVQRDRGHRGNRMQVIFGGGNKLTARGPFLDLLQALRRGLAAANRLTVIGYSFRDSHVNEYVRRWLVSSPDRKLRIIAPGLQGGIMERVHADREDESHWLLALRADQIEWLNERAEVAASTLFP